MKIVIPESESNNNCNNMDNNTDEDEHIQPMMDFSQYSDD